RDDRADWPGFHPDRVGRRDPGAECRASRGGACPCSARDCARSPGFAQAARRADVTELRSSPPTPSDQCAGGGRGLDRWRSARTREPRREPRVNGEVSPAEMQELDELQRWMALKLRELR